MFLPMFRVVVVAIVVVAFAVTSLPAYAAPLAEGKAAAKVESGWFESAVAWLSQTIFGDQPVNSGTSSPKKAILMNGSCIDPWGRCP